MVIYRRGGLPAVQRPVSNLDSFYMRDSYMERLQLASGLWTTRDQRSAIRISECSEIREQR